MFIKGCIAHLCHLPGLDQVGHSPRGTSGSAGTLNWDPMWLGPQFSPHQIFPTPVPPWWEEEWKMGVPGGWYIVSHQGLKDPWESAFSWLVCSTPPRALQDLPPIPFLTIPSLQMWWLSFYPRFWTYFQNFFLFSLLWLFC